MMVYFADGRIRGMVLITSERLYADWTLLSTLMVRVGVHYNYYCPVVADMTVKDSASLLVLVFPEVLGEVKYIFPYAIDLDAPGTGI
jgi:hypothetical protein